MQMRLPEQVNAVLRRLGERGYAAFVVGGCVRDSLLGIVPHDWDVCTGALPDAIKDCFAGHRVLTTGIRHGTLTVFIQNMPIEITTFRSDGTYTDHRHPDSVAFTGDVCEDLQRRDFTINAMAYHPDTGLLDPFGGEADLDARRIRCVGDPDERFFEDALRILRALRFSSTLSFAIEDMTARSIHHNAGLLVSIAGERIADELNRLLLGTNVFDVLKAYPDVLGVPIPEILPCVGFDQRSKYHHLTVWEHTCQCLRNADNDRVVRLALLLHDVAKPACFTVGDDGHGHFYGHPAVGAQMAENILHRLRYDAKTISQVVTLIRYHDATLGATKPAVRRYLNRIGEETLHKLLAVKRADASAHVRPQDGYARIDAFYRVLQDVLASDDCFTLSDLAIGGGDVLSCGVAEGPLVGEILSALLDEVMDGRLQNEKETLLKRAAALASGRS